MLNYYGNENNSKLYGGSVVMIAAKVYAKLEIMEIMEYETWAVV